MKPSSSSMDKPRAKRGYFIINDKKIPVYDGINIIGRNKEATVIIKDSNVSHQHAILVITEKDHYLSDIKSINGTFMENTKLIPFQLYSISDKALVKFSTVKATYFFIQDGEVILENTQSQMVDETIYCSKTQLFNSDVLINMQSELVNQPEQVVSLSSQNYYVADDIDLAGVEVTTLSIHELPTQKVDDMYETSEILNAQQTRVFVNGMPTKLDEGSCNNDKSKIVSIHELPTQKLDDSIKNVPQPSETKSTDEAFQFCINDAPTQIVNLNDRSGYEIENVKSNNESVSDSLNVIDETIMDDSIINKNEKLADPEIADENTRDSIDFITMKPTSQYFVDSADTDSQSFLHTSQLTKKKSSVIKSDDEYSEQNEEKSNKRILNENDSSSDETDVEDTIKEKKYYTNSEFEVHFSKLSKRKRNIITSDEEDSNEVDNKIGKKDIDSKLSMHVSEALKKKRNIIMSDEEDNDEINRTSSIENKSKSTESSDDTDVEIDTKHTKKIDVPEMEDNKQERVESSLEETDIESGCNLNGISRTKKKYLKKHRSNKNSNGDVFKNVVIDNVQDVSESETDLETENDNAKTAETNGGKTEFDLSGKLNDTDLIPPTQNCFEGEIDFEFNTQDLMSKSNEFKNSNNNDLQIDSYNKVKIDTVEQTDASAIHDAMGMKKLDANKNVHKNELNLTNKFNDSDVIQATPNCFEGDINFDFNTQDLYSKTNKCENSIESTIPNQNDNSICNSEQVLSESFHLALSCSVDTNTETDIIDKLSVGSSEKVTITKDSDAIFLQPTQKLPPFDCSVQPKTQDLHTTKKCFDTMGKTINKAGDKNSDKCKIKTTDNESSIFLKPQKENVSILDDNDDIFLQPTQQLLPEKTSEQFDTQLRSRIPKSDVFLHPTQKMTQSDNVLALDDDDDIFLQPTQQISLSERKSEKFDAHLPSIISRSDVSLRPTQKLIQKNNVLAHVDDDDDDDDNIFLQPTQQFSLPEKTSERFDAQLPLKVPESDVFLCPTQKMTQRDNILSHDDDDIYLQPTQQLSLCGRSSERLQSKVSKSNVFKCTPKISQKENVVAQDDDDIFLQCTQQLTLPETRYEKAQLSENSTENKLKEKVQPKSIKADITFDNNTDDLFLQPTQLLPVCKEAQEEEISFQTCERRSKFTENLTENKIKMDVKVDKCQSVTEKNIHDNIFQQQTQTETEEDPFLGPTQKIHIECAKGGNENKHTFLVPTRDSVSVNQTQSVEEKLADIFRPTQPDAAELPTAIEANDSLFLEATQIIDEKYVSITPITSKVEEKTDHVESQLEVMFASQNVKLTDIDDLRPPNPLVNVFNDVIAGSIGSQDVEVVPSAFNSINNQNDAKIKPTEKSKKRNAALSNENDEDAGSIKSFEKKKGKTTRKTRSGKTSCDEIKEQLMNNDLKQYAGAKLRRSRRNSTKDVNINMSVINNNDKGLDNITESENLHGKISSKTAQSKEVEINKTSKDIGIKISMEHLPEVDNAPDSPNTGSAKDVNIKKPTKNINITVTEGNVNIEGNNTNDKPLKILPQNETTRTRAKRKFTKTETPSKGSKVEQSADKLTIKLNHLITNLVTNTPTIETLPSSLTDLNPAESSKMARRTRKASTTSEDDFFVKAPKRTKGRVIESDNDKSCGVSLTTPVKSKKLQATVDTPERYKRTQKPKVVFTMLDSPELESVIRSLGGSVVDTVDACTVLLTGCIKRSQKLLTAVGQGKPICSPKWLHESKKLGKFIDPWDYILEDDEAEQRWNFSLRESLNRSSNKKLLENYTCLLVVFSAQDVLKGAIEACGGKCVSRAPPKNSTATLVVVANPENKQKYSRFLKQNPRPLIVASEAIFDGVLRQELNFEDHILT